MPFQPGDILYGALILAVAGLSYRIMRATNWAFFMKALALGGGFALAMDFHNKMGWRLEAEHLSLWLAATPDRAIIAGTLTGLLLALRDRYAPMLSEAGLLLHQATLKARMETSRLKRDMEVAIDQREAAMLAETKTRIREERDAFEQDLRAERRAFEATLEQDRARLAEERAQWDATKKAAHYGDPYKILGLKEGADAAAIKARYRELIAQYHPDKAANTTPEIRALAEEKTKEINWAYGEVFS